MQAAVRGLGIDIFTLIELSFQFVFSWFLLCLFSRSNKPVLVVSSSSNCERGWSDRASLREKYFTTSESSSVSILCMVVMRAFAFDCDLTICELFYQSGTNFYNNFEQSEWGFNSEALFTPISVAFTEILQEYIIKNKETSLKSFANRTNRRDDREIKWN